MKNHKVINLHMSLPNRENKNVAKEEFQLKLKKKFLKLVLY